VNFLRRLPTSRLLLLCASVLVLAGGGAAIATTAFSGGPKPAPKPLNVAVHDALGASAVDGVTARIKFTNELIDGSSLQRGDPLLKGASGRLWASSKTHSLRLELQSDRGDAQIVVNGRNAWLYDASSNTVYRGQLPQHSAKDAERESGKHEIPSLKQISDAISHIDRNANLSGAIPDSIAGQKAYRVRISPKHDGGLLGAGELAWDAAHGLPLRAAIYAQGSSSPVLELTATDISFGAVDSSVFSISPPKGAKVVEVKQSKAAQARHRARAARRNARQREVRGPQAVQAELPFRLTAPATLAGIPRHDVRLLSWDGSPAALVTYGENLGGIAVIEQKLKPGENSNGNGGGDKSGHEDQLPKVSVNGATGTELATALGTVVRFEHGGVAYTVLGSIPAQAAEAAARDL
jgi:outer membrane lipoprotein-sorting protein